MLTADLALAIGSLDLEVRFEVADGQVLALLGPSGAGKTTVLRALAGLQGIDRGRIELDGSLLAEPGSGVFVAAEDRPVGMVFQDYLLFPHMCALDNVAFGLRARGVAKQAANAIATSWIDRVGLGDLAQSKPSEVSGGQAQRIALARALATDPAVLLLDEPLAALDVATRAIVRRDLGHHLAEYEGSTVLVTHDPLDALALADHVVILEDGSVTQAGSIAEVSSRPRTPYVAELLGVNLLRGVGTDHEVQLDGGVTVVTGTALDGPAFALVRPSAVSLHLHEPDTSARNQWRLTVEGFDLLGDRVRVRLTGHLDIAAEITPATLAEFGLVQGTEVWASCKATDITAYPA